MLSKLKQLMKADPLERLVRAADEADKRFSPEMFKYRFNPISGQYPSFITNIGEEGYLMWKRKMRNNWPLTLLSLTTISPVITCLFL